VTLRHLLTHTAGYGYDMWNPELGRWLHHTGLSRQVADWETAARQPLLFDPGARWNYGINTDFVGKAVEAVSGIRLDLYLADHVLGPLGMHDTGVALSDEQRARQARMHARGADGALQPMEFRVGGAPAFFMGGGALCGTGPDYIRFVRALLAGGAGVLRPETVADMGRNHIGELFVGTMRTAMPAMSGDAEFFPGMPKKWGLGFLINTETAPTGRSAWSLAWAGLGNCYYWIDPAAGVGGLVLMQILPFADTAALDVFAAFETAVYAARG
jgi:CubicO group peptidase (beta-lactamase class C family)